MVRTSLEEIIGGIDRVLAGEHTIDSLKHELAQTRDTLRACIVRYTPMSDSVRTEVVEPDTTQLHEYETTLGSLKSSDMALEEEIRRLRGDLRLLKKMFVMHRCAPLKQIKNDLSCQLRETKFFKNRQW